MCIVWNRIFSCGHYLETDRWDQCKQFIETSDCAGDTVRSQSVPRKCWLCSARLRSGSETLNYLNVREFGDVEATVTADRFGRMLGPTPQESRVTDRGSNPGGPSRAERAHTIGAVGGGRQGCLIERAGNFGSGTAERSQTVKSSNPLRSIAQGGFFERSGAFQRISDAEPTRPSG
ncbi:hypothetical protein PVAG01_06117 [Phlyctema vagabunda]|uniref:Uncharacterized protein n=1 Tax=Phlyctema vagabunda TaxID=108571 RepID=A0ABR4PF57_9HELO